MYRRLAEGPPSCECVSRMLEQEPSRNVLPSIARKHRIDVYRTDATYRRPASGLARTTHNTQRRPAQRRPAPFDAPAPSDAPAPHPTPTFLHPARRSYTLSRPALTLLCLDETPRQRIVVPRPCPFCVHSNSSTVYASGPGLGSRRHDVLPSGERRHTGW